MRTLIATLALGLGSFVSVLQAQDPQKLPPKAVVDTVSSLKVQNNRKVPVAVYLEAGRFPFRLGVVSSEKTTVLPLPPSTYAGLANVRLFVHPEGEAGDLASQNFALPRATQLMLVVPSFGDMDREGTDTMTQVLKPEELAEATITVDNPRTVPVTVFAKRLTYVTRIGVIAPSSRSTLQFPTSVVAWNQTLTVFLHPEGGRDLATETFKIKRGEHLGLRVPRQ